MNNRDLQIALFEVLEKIVIRHEDMNDNDKDVLFEAFTKRGEEYADSILGLMKRDMKIDEIVENNEAAGNLVKDAYVWGFMKRVLENFNYDEWILI